MVGVRNRVLVATGVVGPAVVLLSLAYGAVTSPVFDWPMDPFSLIGTGDGRTATLFNAGLALGGFATSLFSVPLWRDGRRLTAGMYGLIGVSLAGAGLVPGREGAVLHELFGAVALFGVGILLLVAGVADWRVGDRRMGSVAVALGAAAMAVWLPYDFGLAWAQIGYGAAEAVSLLAFATWSGWETTRYWDLSCRRTKDDSGEVSQ